MAFLRRKQENLNRDAPDLGFGTLLGDEAGRFIERDGRFHVRKVGPTGWHPYEHLVEMPWWPFFGVVLAYYVGINLVFAFGFGLIGLDQIGGMPVGGWRGLAEAFFFSVQTFTSVGYGAVHPTGMGANLLASLVALVGLMSFALATGLVFARFSKPRARIAFSGFGVITPFRDGTAFMMRMVHRRNHHLIDLEARMMLTWYGNQDGGGRKRQFAMLDLELNRISLFPMNWTLVHPITEKSPLWKKTASDLQDMHVEFLIMVKGFDETYHQEVHARSSYLFDEVRWGVKFAPMVRSEAGKATIVDLSLLDATLPSEG